MGEIVGAVDHSAKLGFKAAVEVDRNAHGFVEQLASVRLDGLLSLLVAGDTVRHRTSQTGNVGSAVEKYTLNKKERTIPEVQQFPPQILFVANKRSEGPSSEGDRRNIRKSPIAEINLPIAVPIEWTEDSTYIMVLPKELHRCCHV